MSGNQIQSTDGSKTIIVKLSKSKKARNTVTLVALIIVLIGIIACQIAMLPKEKEPGATRLVQCFKCENRCDMKVVDIKKCKCPKCEGKVGFVYKCQACDFEFPLILKTISGKKNLKEILETQKRETKCPNCGARGSRPMTAK